MPDDEILDDFELVTSARQVKKPPKLRKERVPLPELQQAFLVWEQSQGDYSDFQDTTRIYENGFLKGVNLKDEDLKYLAYCLRDPDNNRLWPNVDEAVAQLRPYGKSIINKLLAAANKVNAANSASAEKNSEVTPSD